MQPYTGRDKWQSCVSEICYIFKYAVVYFRKIYIQVLLLQSTGSQIHFLPERHRLTIPSNCSWTDFKLTAVSVLTQGEVHGSIAAQWEDSSLINTNNTVTVNMCFTSVFKSLQ